MTALDALVAVCVAVLAASPGLIALIQQRKRNTVDLAEKFEQMNMRQIEISEARRRQIEELQAALEKEHAERKAGEEAMKAQVAELQATMQEWEAGIRILTDSLVANQIPVPWKPKPHPARVAL